MADEKKPAPWWKRMVTLPADRNSLSDIVKLNRKDVQKGADAAERAALMKLRQIIPDIAPDLEDAAVEAVRSGIERFLSQVGVRP